MRDVIETLELNADYRYALYYDDSAFDYLSDWDHDSWGLYTLSSSQWTRNLALDTFGINDRIRTAWEYNRDESAAAKAIERAGYCQQQVLLRDYNSQSVWAETIVYWDPELLTESKGLIDELKAWFGGNVFTVALEHRDVYYGPNGKTIETWEIEESLSNVIFFDGYEFTADNCAELLCAAELVAV
jgi:hypothetical protein